MRLVRLISLSIAFSGVVACGDGTAPPSVGPVPRVLVEGPVGPASGIVLQGTGFDLAEVGYERAEYFVSGVARAFAPLGPLSADGHWKIEESGATAAYRTRFVVHRPTDPARFSGLVHVEWLNVSAGFDSAPDWISAHVEFIRRGHVWVGVSAQYVGVEGAPGGGPIPGIDFALKRSNPERYGDLAHPGDPYSYDIFAQVGGAMRQRDGVDPLGGLVASHVVAVGQSQSASRLVTFINGPGPHVHVFDGYFVHSRSASAAPLSQSPLEEVPAPAVVRIRTDLESPTLVIEPEGDVARSFFRARQPDSPSVVTWESAGHAHADLYTLLDGASDRGGDPSVAVVGFVSEPIPGIIACEAAVNSGKFHFVLKAAFRRHEEWVREGIRPPVSPRIELLDSPESGPATVAYDELGLARGGIRSPYVDVPVARVIGEPNGGAAFCFLFGKTIPFPDETLERLYPTRESYVDAVRASAQKAVSEGFYLAEDAELVSRAAEVQPGIGPS
jgi:hypothetical protein